MNEIREKINLFVTRRSEAAEALNSITPLLKPYMEFIKSDCDWVDYVIYENTTNQVVIHYEDWDEFYPEDRSKTERIGLEYFDDPEAYVSKLKAQKEQDEKEREKRDKERKDEESRKSDLEQFEKLKNKLFPNENSDCRSENVQQQIRSKKIYPDEELIDMFHEKKTDYYNTPQNIENRLMWLTMLKTLVEDGQF